MPALLTWRCPHHWAVARRRVPCAMPACRTLAPSQDFWLEVEPVPCTRGLVQHNSKLQGDSAQQQASRSPPCTRDQPSVAASHVRPTGPARCDCSASTPAIRNVSCHNPPGQAPSCFATAALRSSATPPLSVGLSRALPPTPLHMAVSLCLQLNSGLAVPGMCVTCVWDNHRPPLIQPRAPVNLSRLYCTAFEHLHMDLRDMRTRMRRRF